MTSPYKGKRGLARIWAALFHSLDGFSAAFRHEDAFRQEVVLALVLIPLALVRAVERTRQGADGGQRAAGADRELLNSAIEALTDRVSLENHELAKRARTWAAPP